MEKEILGLSVNDSRIKKSINEKWVLTIGSGILQEFPNRKTALNYIKKTSILPFHEIDKDHYLMGNMHLVPKSKLRFCS